MNESQLSVAVIELKQTVAKIEEKMDGTLKRMDEQQQLSKTIYENSSAFKLLGAQIEHILTGQTYLRQELDEIRMKPAKRWDSIIDKIILMIVTTAVGYLFARTMGN